MISSSDLKRLSSAKRGEERLGGTPDHTSPERRSQPTTGMGSGAAKSRGGIESAGASRGSLRALSVMLSSAVCHNENQEVEVKQRKFPPQQPKLPPRLVLLEGDPALISATLHAVSISIERSENSPFL